MKGEGERVQDKGKANGFHFILHSSAFTLAKLPAGPALP
jgi:hypothetical protein